jgi:hypothetical protein
MITVGDLLKVICDDKSLCIFNTIGLATNHDSDILIRNMDSVVNNSICESRR